MPSPRGGHVTADGRHHKAQKIENLLARHVTLAECDLLDLGAGSGLLSRYFQPCVRSVTAADRDTEPFEPDDITIQPTDGPKLPFESGSFDLVIYNHVIEHVGTRTEQAESLAEIKRVLRPGGVLYLAVPNRYTLIEPHYRLPFLSWLPAGLANRWVVKTGKNDWYDCNPFAAGELSSFLKRAGFEPYDATRDAFYELLRIEKSDSMVGRLLMATPGIFVSLFYPVMPTFVMICRVQGDQTH